MTPTGPSAAGPPAGAAALADMVHDIRGCIAPLMNALEVIRMAAGDNPAVAGALKITDRQTRALTELVSGLLRLPEAGGS